MELKFLISIIVLIFLFNGKEAEQTEYLICRECGADIADSYYLHNHFSSLALQVGNQTIVGNSGIKVQVFINLFGIKYTVINTHKAVCSPVGEWEEADTWFPGFAWKNCVCPYCGTPLGWIFEPIDFINTDKQKSAESRFYALILDHILSDKFTDSLLISPK